MTATETRDQSDADCFETCELDEDCAGDFCACSVDYCSEQACMHDFSGCGTTVSNSGPVSAGSLAMVFVDLNCRFQINSVFCTTGGAEICIGASPIRLTDNGDGSYTGSFAACEATSVTVTCEWFTPDGTFSDSTIVQFN